jgi:putative polyhydroxyalkanoate system protein
VSTITVTQGHALGVEPAKKALAQFEADVAKFGLKLIWNGTSGELKGTGASGDVRVTDSNVTVTVKLGMVAKIAGVDPERLKASIEKRLKSALLPSPA